MSDQTSAPDAAPAQMPVIEPEPHLFRAVKGRTFHYSDKAVPLDHMDTEVTAICGARFHRWYVYQGRGNPTCNRCREVLVNRIEQALAQSGGAGEGAEGNG